jgi:hypothetical protein
MELLTVELVELGPGTVLNQLAEELEILVVPLPTLELRDLTVVAD